MFFRFDRQSIVVYATHHMLTQVNGREGAKGWAFYPKGFFGEWRPDNNVARRSMARPKRVCYSVGVGWVFAIEMRMMASRADLHPVGIVYANSHPEAVIPASNIVGTIGYLATTKSKRVKVKLAAAG
ncbi:MAG: hypothetical protein V4438_02725 [Patescibacteria group bacterium]